MQIDFTTPALLFSTISLLLLAYTNRFLGLASSLALSIIEIRMSVGALDMHLKDMET